MSQDFFRRTPRGFDERPHQQLVRHPHFQSLKRRQQASLAHINDGRDLIGARAAKEICEDVEHLQALGSGLQAFEDLGEMAKSHQATPRRLNGWLKTSAGPYRVWDEPIP